jgi:hypothetical protein
MQKQLKDNTSPVPDNKALVLLRRLEYTEENYFRLENSSPLLNEKDNDNKKKKNSESVHDVEVILLDLTK